MGRASPRRAATALAVGVATTACGAPPPVIAVSGSSTVAPISSFVADEFNHAGSGAQITVDDPGTGDGFAAFCRGELAVADASRPIHADEAERCAEAGIRSVELEVALDGIVVLTSAANDTVDCLTTADLYALLGPESGGVDRWDDAAELAGRLGSTTELPDAPLDVTAPGTESGTYDAFVELALGPVAARRVDAGAIDEEQAASLRTDYSSQADDNAIIAGIEGSDGSLGFVGFAFAEGAGDGVRALAVDGGDGCVAPSAETIADGTYPIARSLYVYVDVGRTADDDDLAGYVDFYLRDDSLTTLVAEAGYVPLPPERIAATRARWESR